MWGNGAAMTTHGIAENSAGRPAQAVDRSAGAGAARGSVILVLLVAGLLVAAATGHRRARPQQRRAVHPRLPGGARHRRRVRAVRAGLAASCGCSSGGAGNPLIKAVVDDAFDGIVVTDSDGRVIYANAAYLDLIDAADANDMRPVERVFIGDADASEAIYRLLKAAREGKRLQEEVRVAGDKGPAGALAAHARAPARRQARAAA